MAWLHTDSLFKQLRSYTEVQQLAGPWEQQLASLTRLTSLSLSSGDLQHVGHLRRAHGVMDEAPDTSHNSSSSSSSSTSEHQKTDREYAELASNERLWVYWLPDWLAAAPGLTSVSIKPSKHSGSSRNTGSGSINSEEVDRNRMPACLMINATELPTEGWEGLSGLKPQELDVSYNELTALSNMALFDASHNPLSGLRAPTVPSLASLELAGCRNLRELWLGWNANLDWGSLQVLQHCTALRMLDLGGMRPGAAAAGGRAEAPPSTSQLLAQLHPRVAVQGMQPRAPVQRF
ncbi:hypothetical protein OEZ85_005470 [Tetradesmus obliquus]|uniref:Uncharacterized protein n=1 Tax=Tetradesmus obliquus TaxID=3088 RepID=A0ABY8UIT7_TETOB|nr:hypothetical protein OEZ85_005470 [Tetradesmus obliquus]